MDDTPVERLLRWEDHGALWRAVHVSDAHAVVDLCACTGEPVERLESGDADLIAFLRERADADQG
jgi:hypothetical protein